MFVAFLNLGIKYCIGDFRDSKGPSSTLLLPETLPCQNAHALIGRGLCFTNTKEEQTGTSVHNLSDINKVWSTLFSCALSVGKKTTFSAKGSADALVI